MGAACEMLARIVQVYDRFSRAPSARAGGTSDKKPPRINSFGHILVTTGNCVRMAPGGRDDQ
ncbi:hypothetical protein CHELA1G11_10501 [Hyphomicrobiales bacterium]|nr:hypothetical protein CHELA1G11_10501 [Hyphomicrobiales bacterium]CAH1674243.1 hypothetical protein CHELA1G2_13804 [Hyphomicrobiales bacterium]